jgi:hypothetical protein
LATITLLSCGRGLVNEHSHGKVEVDTTPSTTEVVSKDRSSAGAVAGLPAFVKSIRPWDPPFNEGPSGSLVMTANYKMYSTLEDGWLQENMPAFLETSLSHYRGSIISLPMPIDPLETYIFGEQRQWQDFTRQLLPGEAGIYLSLGKGGYTTEGKAVLRDIGRWDTICITAHEGWHQYGQSVFEESLPPWLDEGLATYMEGCRFERTQEVPVFMPWRNFERFNELRRCARVGRLYSLQEIVTLSPQSFLERGREHLLAYYAQVWVFIHFLMEGEQGRYRDGVESVLQDAWLGRLGRTLVTSPQLGSINDRRRVAKGARGYATAVVYFNSDLDELEEQYRAFLAKVVSRGSGSAIARGRSPIDRVESSPPVTVAVVTPKPTVPAATVPAATAEKAERAPAPEFIKEEDEVLCTDDVYGDLDGDCFVTRTDVLILLERWGTTDSAADLSGDFVVNEVDYGMMFDLLSPEPVDP